MKTHKVDSLLLSNGLGCRISWLARLVGMRRMIARTGLAAAFLCSCSAAYGACGPHEVAAANLRENHQEAVHARALSETGRMLEVWVNYRTGAWTILLTNPNGISCPVDGGFGWVTYPMGDDL